MYGLGQCEAETRAFLARHKGQVTTTTKFGLAIGGSEAGLRRIQGPVRKLLNTFPGLRKIVRRAVGSNTVKRGFTVEEAAASLDKSLTEMGVESVDLFLAHDAELGDFDGEGLADRMQAWQQEGKVGGTGVSGNVMESIAVATRYPAFGRVIQVPHDVYQPKMPEVLAAANGVVGTFSLLRRCLEPTKALLSQETALRDEWSQRLDLDLKDDELIAASLISCSRAENPSGIAIIYTARPDRLKKLLQAIEHLDGRPEAVVEMTKLLRATWKGGDPVREGF